MADEFNLHLDLTPIVDAAKGMTDSLRSRLQTAVSNLSAQAHAHVKEQAAAKLHTRRDLFNDNLDFEQIDKNTWVITVRAKARWIEDGMEPHSMLQDLLASPKARTKKGGGKYIIIPFKHSKGDTQQTPHQRAVKQALKQELKKLDIPYGKVERNPDGSPRTGLLHSHDFDRTQKKLGDHEEGPASFPLSTFAKTRGEGPEGRPYLHGVRVYQRLKKNPDGTVQTDKQGRAKASREIFTFRVASSSQSQNKWFHPGLAPMHFLDEAYEWAKREFEQNIVPEIMREL